MEISIKKKELRAASFTTTSIPIEVSPVLLQGNRIKAKVEGVSRWFEVIYTKAPGIYEVIPSALNEMRSIKKEEWLTIFIKYEKMLGDVIKAGNWNSLIIDIGEGEGLFKVDLKEKSRTNVYRVFDVASDDLIISVEESDYQAFPNSDFGGNIVINLFFSVGEDKLEAICNYLIRRGILEYYKCEVSDIIQRIQQSNHSFNIQLIDVSLIRHAMRDCHKAIIILSHHFKCPKVSESYLWSAQNYGWFLPKDREIIGFTDGGFMLRNGFCSYKELLKTPNSRTVMVALQKNIIRMLREDYGTYYLPVLIIE